MASAVGDLVVRIQAVTKDFEQGIAKSQTSMQKFAQASKIALRGIAASGAAAAASLTALTTRGLSTGSEILRWSRRLGASSEFILSLKFAASELGTDLDTVAESFEDLQERIAEAAFGTGEAKDALDRLGVSAAALFRLPVREQFMVLSDAISNVGTEGEKTLAIAELFSDSAKKLLPLMRDGSKGLRDVEKRMRDLGVTVRDDNLKQIARFRLAWKDLTQQADAFGIVLAGAVSPALEALVNILHQIFPFANRSFDRLNEILSTLSLSFTALADRMDRVVISARAMANILNQKIGTAAVNIGGPFKRFGETLLGASAIRAKNIIRDLANLDESNLTRSLLRSRRLMDGSVDPFGRPSDQKPAAAVAKATSVEFAGALERGSAEASSSILRSIFGKRMQDGVEAQKETAKNTDDIFQFLGQAFDKIAQIGIPQ